jgi:hypothetical protein
MLVHDNDAGASETPGGTTVPVPVTDAVAGKFEVLFATFTLADRSPAAVGENSTVTVQVSVGPSVFGISGQSDVAAKSFSVVDTEEIKIGNRDLFSRVNFCFALVSPNSTAPKFWLAGSRVTDPELEPFKWKPQPVARATTHDSSSTERKGPDLLRTTGTLTTSRGRYRVPISKSKS